jgi:hypothetical protein
LSAGDCIHNYVIGNCPICGMREDEVKLGATGELRAALQGLVDRLDQIHADPAYKSVWTSYHVHGGRYDGPTYVEALARARAALAGLDEVHA